jgi:regulator of replication initiation timing
MRTVIIILFVVLIGFGFLLSDNLNTHQDLQEIQRINQKLESEKQKLLGQLSTQSQSIDELGQQLAQVKSEKQSFENAVQTLTTEKQQLTSALEDANAQLSKSAQEISSLRQQVSSLQNSNNVLAAENVFLKGTGASRSVVESQATQWLIPATGEANRGTLLVSASLFFGLPLSVIVAYMLNRRARGRGLKHLPVATARPERKIMAHLSEEEKELIIRLRRNKGG